MQIRTLLTAAAIPVGSILAQSTTATTTAAASSTTDLDSLVSQLPECALGCLSSAAADIGCSASDLTCLCSKSSDLISSIGPCIVISSGCTSDEQSEMSSLATNICSDVDTSNSTELASASNYITSALATATSAAATSASASGNAAMRTDLPVAGIGAMGVAAALAVLAL